MRVDGFSTWKTVSAKFPQWRRDCFGDAELALLVQDHEKGLRAQPSLDAIKKAGVKLVGNFPKHSPDLNHIERWSHRLRQRLEERAPMELESREAFIARLRRTVTSMNSHWSDQGREHCTNQKARAREVKKLLGARCSY
jgi:hypothetical protein